MIDLFIKFVLNNYTKTLY